MKRGVLINPEVEEINHGLIIRRAREGENHKVLHKSLEGHKERNEIYLSF